MAVDSSAVDGGGLQVTVSVALGPHAVRETSMRLPLGSTVQTALTAASDLIAAGSTGREGGDEFEVTLWGRRAPDDQLLRDMDRIELTRALRVDPKVARRERFAKQGAGRTGLFAKRRPGAKAGY